MAPHVHCWLIVRPQRGPPDDTLVVGDDCGGYANRLVSIVHLFVYAMLHDFVPLVDWSVSGVPIAPQVFHSLFFNWTYDAGVVVWDAAPHAVPLRCEPHSREQRRRAVLQRRQ